MADRDPTSAEESHQLSRQQGEDKHPCDAHHRAQAAASASLLAR